MDQSTDQFLVLNNKSGVKIFNQKARKKVWWASTHVSGKVCVCACVCDYKRESVAAAHRHVPSIGGAANEFIQGPSPTPPRIGERANTRRTNPGRI